MGKETGIQYADGTTNPVVGCGGCIHFKSPKETLKAIDDALAKFNVNPCAKMHYRNLVDQFHEQIEDPSKHQRKVVSTTNIYHLRKEFCEPIRREHGDEVSLAASDAIEKSITCWAAKVILNKGYSLKPKPDGTPRKPKKGVAPTFEEVTTFAGRVERASLLPDLLGKDDPDRPWISGLPRIFFVGDLGDTYSRRSDFSFLKEEVVAPFCSESGLRHLWLTFTKIPKRMAEFSDEIGGFSKNVCALTSLTGPGDLHRVDDLRKVKASTRGLSLEPLWERIPPDQLDLTGIDWVIVGGASGSRRIAHPFPLEWAEELRDHCAEKGVAFFLKQLGRNPTRNGKLLKLKNSHGGDWKEWDEALRVREFPCYFHDYRAGQGQPGVRRPREGGLTVSEASDFKRLNKVVSKAAKVFVDAGKALHEIRERRLYRAKYKTFQAYCEAVHHISRQYANKLIQAGAIYAEMTPFVSKLGLPMPTNEAQFREVGRLPDTDVRVDALKTAIDVANDTNSGRLTASILKEVVDKRLEQSKPQGHRSVPLARRVVLAIRKIDCFEKSEGRTEEVDEFLANLRVILTGEIASGESPEEA